MPAFEEEGPGGPFKQMDVKRHFEAIADRYPNVPPEAIRRYIDGEISLNDLWYLDLIGKSNFPFKQYDTGY